MKYTWLVEKYLEGELPDQELHDFEHLILRDPEIAAEIERIRGLDRFMRKQHSRLISTTELLEDYGDMENVIPAVELESEFEDLRIKKAGRDSQTISDLVTRLNESRYSQDLTERKSDKVLIRKTTVWLAAASTVLILSIGGLLLFETGRPADTSGLYMAYFEPYPADISQRSVNGHEGMFRDALKQYDQGNFPIALDIMNSIPESALPNSTFYLYKGIASMELQNYTDALQCFSHLEKDIVLRQYSDWYSALCYLKMDQTEKVRELLATIVSEEGFNYRKAEEILKKL